MSRPEGEEVRFKLFVFVFFLSAASGGSAFAQRVEFVTLGRETIEARLKESSAKNPVRQSNLYRLFQEAGCTGDLLAKQPVKGSGLPNVICTLPGSTDSMIVVGAHFDKVNRGSGVVDNWSGAALLPSLFESLHAHPRTHTFVFLGFTDEERGLRGSEFYAKRMTEDERARTRGMINMDSLGLASTKVWVSRADKKLLSLLARTANTLQLPLEGVNVDRVGTTDSEPFAKRKIPTITIHSVTQETWPILHSANDTLSAIKLGGYYETYRLITAFLAVLDVTPEETGPAAQ